MDVFNNIFKLCRKRHNVSRETLEKFYVYERILLEWQDKLNLIGKNTICDIWSRHFADSAQILLHVNELKGQWIDIGSGAGFPGAVIGILMSDVKARVILVESNAKKCAFLREIKIRTEANFDIINARIEEVKKQYPNISADYIVTRGVANISKILEYCNNLTGVKAKLILHKGKYVDRELSEACKNWKIVYTIKKSIVNQEGCLVIVEDFEKYR